MYSIMWTKKQVLRMMCLSMLITLIGGVILTVEVFSPSPAYAAVGKAAVWILDSNGNKIDGKGYTAAGWVAHSYHRNSDGTARLLWTQPNRAAVWFLNSSGNKVGGKGYTAVGWSARSYRQYSDGTATLLWAKTDRAAVWFLNSSGNKTGGKGYTASGWTAHSYVRNSDGTATLLWTKTNRAAVWFLNSSGNKTGGKGYTASGWVATSYQGAGAQGSFAVMGVNYDLSLTIRKAGTGTGTVTAGEQVCDEVCSEFSIPYVEGEKVDVEVTSAVDSYFAGWETADGTSLENIYYANPGDTVFAIFERK